MALFHIYTIIWTLSGLIEKNVALCKCFAKPYSDEASNKLSDASMSEEQKEDYMADFAKNLLEDCARKIGIDPDEVNWQKPK